jgi:hypothetical protein
VGSDEINGIKGHAGFPCDLLDCFCRKMCEENVQAAHDVDAAGSGERARKDETADGPGEGIHAEGTEPDSGLDSAPSDLHQGRVDAVHRRAGHQSHDELPLFAMQPKELFHGIFSIVMEAIVRNHG